MLKNSTKNLTMITKLNQEQFIEEITKRINSLIKSGPVFIPGGSSFREVYRSLKITPDQKHPILLTDDRLVDLMDKASNFGNLIRLNEELLDILSDSYYEWINKSTEEYVDLKITEILRSKERYSIFLGVGLDGHVASLFDPALVTNLFQGKTISILRKHDDEFDRITIKKDVIMKAENICIVINGMGKEYLVSLIDSDSPVPSPLNEIIKLSKTEIFYVN